MIQPNYCLPIIKHRKVEVLEVIQANKAEYDYFEVWLDYIEDLDEFFVLSLADRLGDGCIVVFRRQNLETPHMELAPRLHILERLSGQGVLVDLDITTQQTELQHIEKHGLHLSVISSYHNYTLTPSEAELRQIIDTMEVRNPAIYKLSTFCKRQQDALRLLQLLLELKEDGRRAVILGMGEPGIVTRIFGTLWGNEIIFAPQDSSESSAPGQLTRQQLATIFKELGA